jgi:hypothetical protein
MNQRIVWVQGLTAEASKQPFAEVKLFGEQQKPLPVKVKKGIV